MLANKSDPKPNNHLTYLFLKMYFQQERLPKEIFIPAKNTLIPDLKKVTDGYIRVIENLIKEKVDLKRSQYAKDNKYWLEIIYLQIQLNKVKPI
jgi:hypothetical protein